MRHATVLALLFLLPTAASARSYGEVEADLKAAVREVLRLEASRASGERRAVELERDVEAAKRDGGLISTLTLRSDLSTLHEAWADVGRIDAHLATARARVDRLYEEAREVATREERARLEVVSGRALERARAALRRAEERGDEEEIESARRSYADARRAFEAHYR